MPYKKLTLYPEKPEKPSQPKVDHPEILRITQEKKAPIIVAQVSQDDPSSGWKKILLDGDPITALGSEGQALLQRATTYDSLVQLRTAGAEYDARQIRNLNAANDFLNAYVKEPAGTTIDPRSIRALTSSDVVTVADIVKSFSETDVMSGKATSQYDNTVKAASATQAFEISLIDVWNNSGADRNVAFRFGTGTLRFEKKIADKTGFLINLVKTKWKGPTNTAFNVYSYEASPAVSYTVFGELV